MKVETIRLSKCCHEEMNDNEVFCPYCQERADTYLTESEIN